jgi:hypothetical protein
MPPDVRGRLIYPLVSTLYCDGFNYNSCNRHQFIPQLIILNNLFGYLSVLIIVKWCICSKADLYHVMIYMFLK